jgi:hypothetical protein
LQLLFRRPCSHIPFAALHLLLQYPQLYLVPLPLPLPSVYFSVQPWHVKASVSPLRLLRGWLLKLLQ